MSDATLAAANNRQAARIAELEAERDRLATEVGRVMAERDQAERERDRLREALTRLDQGDWLGLDAHQLISAALSPTPPAEETP